MLFLFVGLSSGAQKVEYPLIFSGKILDTITSLRDEEKYSEALKYCYRIPVNDTNYREAIYQLAYTHLLNKSYDSSVHYAKAGAEIFPEAEMQFLHLAVSGYDYADSSAAALSLITKLIGQYPHFPQLYHSRGAIYTKLKKDAEAGADFQRALVINSFFASAHYALGEWYYNRGDFVSAVLAFQTYLLLAPQGKYLSPTIKYLGNLTTITDEIQDLAAKADFSDNRSFETIQQVLLSSAALSKKYQLKVSLDDNIIRQLQACNELLKFEEGTSHFAMQYYVPFYEKTFKDGKFDALIYSMLSALDIKDVKTWLKKNEKRTDEYGTEGYEYFNNIRVSRELFYAKRKAAKVCYQWDDGVLTAYGPCNNLDVENYSGNWKVFHSNGKLASEGLFNNKQEREGEWNYYYDNGQLKERSNLKGGKAEGSITTWHKSGQVSIAYEIKNGLQEGIEKNYFYNGVLRNEVLYKNGKRNGRETAYNYKGYKISEGTFTDDEYDGLLVNYYENGRIKDSLMYKKGVPEGNYVKYSSTGAVMEKGAFVNGKRNGEWTSWYNDSVMSEKTVYLNGEITGEFSEYHKNGTISRKGKYFKGEIDGMIEDFDDDGKMYSDIEMDKGRVRNISFYDKAGNKTQSFSTSKGNIGITFFDPKGLKLSDGNFTRDGLKQGEFTDYFASGKVSGKSIYRNNMLDGISMAFHVNGEKKFETQYAENEINGFNIWYHVNGKKSSEGWFQNGVKQQYVALFNEAGNLTNLDYYLNGEAHGYNANFFPNGKTKFNQLYYNGWIQKIWQYDSLGNQLSYHDLTSGKGEVVYLYMNGAPYVRQNFDHFVLNGDYTVYYPDGSVQTKRTYVKDGFHGPSVWNYPFNQLEEAGNFSFGQKTGEWKTYHTNGQLSFLENYKEGELDGETKIYRTDGSLLRTENYEGGVRQGASVWYGLKNEVLIQFHYKNGVLASYTYPDATGKLKPAVAVTKRTSMITAQYANGTKSVQISMKEGDFHGATQVFYQDGKPMAVAHYEAGVLHGPRATYYPDGSIWSEDTFIANARYGPRRIFQKNGKPLVSEMFHAGSLHGECNYYDATGKLVSSYFYYDGVPEKKLK